MPHDRFLAALASELATLDGRGNPKRHELVIEGVVPAAEGYGPRYRVAGHATPFLKMNSNNYLGMNLRREVIEAEEEASRKYGAGPGAVRFISGTYAPHVELEATLARGTYLLVARAPGFADGRHRDGPIAGVEGDGHRRTHPGGGDRDRPEDGPRPGPPGAGDGLGGRASADRRGLDAFDTQMTRVEHVALLQRFGEYVDLRERADQERQRHDHLQLVVDQHVDVDRDRTADRKSVV